MLGRSLLCVMLVAMIIGQGYLPPTTYHVTDIMPIALVFLLIAASAGLTRGADLFSMFGVGAMMGLGSSAHGGATGKGINASHAATMALGAKKHAAGVGAIGGALGKRAFSKAKKKIAAARNAKKEAKAQAQKDKAMKAMAAGATTGAPKNGVLMRMAVARYKRKENREIKRLRNAQGKVQTLQKKGVTGSRLERAKRKETLSRLRVNAARVGASGNIIGARTILATGKAQMKVAAASKKFDAAAAAAVGGGIWATMKLNRAEANLAYARGKRNAAVFKAQGRKADAKVALASALVNRRAVQLGQKLKKREAKIDAKNERITKRNETRSPDKKKSLKALTYSTMVRGGAHNLPGGAIIGFGTVAATARFNRAEAKLEAAQAKRDHKNLISEGKLSKKFNKVGMGGLNATEQSRMKRMFGEYKSANAKKEAETKAAEAKGAKSTPPNAAPPVKKRTTRMKEWASRNLTRNGIKGAAGRSRVRAGAWASRNLSRKGVRGWGKRNFTRTGIKENSWTYKKMKGVADYANKKMYGVADYAKMQDRQRREAYKVIGKDGKPKRLSRRKLAKLEYAKVGAEQRYGDFYRRHTVRAKPDDRLLKMRGRTANGDRGRWSRSEDTDAYLGRHGLRERVRKHYGGLGERPKDAPPPLIDTKDGSVSSRGAKGASAPPPSSPGSPSTSRTPSSSSAAPAQGGGASMARPPKGRDISHYGSDVQQAYKNYNSGKATGKEEDLLRSKGFSFPAPSAPTWSSPTRTSVLPPKRNLPPTSRNLEREAADLNGKAMLLEAAVGGKVATDTRAAANSVLHASKTAALAESAEVKAKSTSNPEDIAKAQRLRADADRALADSVIIKATTQSIPLSEFNLKKEAAESKFDTLRQQKFDEFKAEAARVGEITDQAKKARADEGRYGSLATQTKEQLKQNPGDPNLSELLKKHETAAREAGKNADALEKRASIAYGYAMASDSTLRQTASLKVMEDVRAGKAKLSNTEIAAAGSGLTGISPEAQAALDKLAPQKPQNPEMKPGEPKPMPPPKNAEESVPYGSPGSKAVRTQEELNEAPPPQPAPSPSPKYTTESLSKMGIDTIRGAGDVPNFILAAEGVKPSVWLVGDEVSDKVALREAAGKLGLTYTEVGMGSTTSFILAKDQSTATQFTEILERRPDFNFTPEEHQKIGILLGFSAADARGFAESSVEGTSSQRSKRYNMELQQLPTELIATVGGFTFHVPESATSESTIAQAQLYRDTLTRAAPDIADSLAQRAIIKYSQAGPQQTPTPPQPEAQPQPVSSLHSINQPPSQDEVKKAAGILGVPVNVSDAELQAAISKKMDELEANKPGTLSSRKTKEEWEKKSDEISNAARDLFINNQLRKKTGGEDKKE